MKTVSVKVKIPDGWELDCDELRLANRGEKYVLSDGTICTAQKDDYGLLFVPKIIVRKIEPWKQPDFLKPGWIAMDENGEWYWYIKEPFYSSDEDQWFSGDNVILMSEVNWTPPKCTDWKQSKRRIE
jgi:hypothetical protein